MKNRLFRSDLGDLIEHFQGHGAGILKIFRYCQLLRKPAMLSGFRLYFFDSTFKPACLVNIQPI